MVATPTRRRERSRGCVTPRAAAGLCLVVACARLGLASAGSIRLTECPTDDPDAPEATFRWVNDGEQLYVEGAGSCVTLSDIYNGMDDPPLVYHTAAGAESSTETG